ncbi:MAG: Mur ligase domain-containing protein, partial [Patescibacteria group bacterium]
MSILDKKYIHFIGIGGIGTSSLAQILHEKGKKITGSDNCASEITKSLKLEGIKIYGNHDQSNITKKHELVVYSPAIPANNPELQKAQQLKIPCLSYPQALGELTKKYYTIAITGTHGKSTTTAMTALTAIKGHLNPTVVIGTKLKEFKNKNYRVGESNYLIIEACEYKRSFLNFHPNILIITNIETEHLDYYKNLKDYQKAFNELAIKVPKNGYIIVNDDDKNVKPVLKGAK